MRSAKFAYAMLQYGVYLLPYLERFGQVELLLRGTPTSLGSKGDTFISHNMPPELIILNPPLCGLVFPAASSGSARPMLALALAVAFSSFTASTRPASNHYRTPSSALDRRVTGERNKPNTVAGRMPRGAPAWTGRSHPSTPTGFVSAKAVARAATQRRSWRRGLALGTGKRGCVLGTRMVGTWWDETDPKQGRGWCGGLRRVRGVNRHEPEGRSLVVVGAGTGETEFYSW